ncbi:hypothetical protein Bca4012_037267 [Brassica carinata]
MIFSKQLAGPCSIPLTPFYLTADQISVSIEPRFEERPETIERRRPSGNFANTSQSLESPPSLR